MTKPLEGIRVLDLTRLLPGPYTTLLLADFGADVIKVEDPQIGDYARYGEPKLAGQGAMFHSLNRNKRSIAIDLKSKEGKETFIELVKTADVVIESFRPGVMDRLGLGYNDLKMHQPKLIYCAISSYGQNGPLRETPGHDINFLSYSGLLELQGASGEKPISSPVQIGDIGGGSLMAAIGILIAIIDMKKTGKGQFIDISMLDGIISWMQTIIPNYLATGLTGNRGELTLSGGRACYEIYETKDNRYLSVGALEPKFWMNFCHVINREDLIPKLEAPLHEQEEMKKEIQDVVKTKTLNEWMRLFEDIDACVSPLLTIDEALNHPQVKYRQMIEEVYHPQYGVIQQISNPIKFSRTKAKTIRQAPKLGEHTEEIMQELESRKQMMIDN